MWLTPGVIFIANHHFGSFPASFQQLWPQEGGSEGWLRNWFAKKADTGQCTKIITRAPKICSKYAGMGKYAAVNPFKRSKYALILHKYVKCALVGSKKRICTTNTKYTQNICYPVNLETCVPPWHADVPRQHPPWKGILHHNNCGTQALLWENFHEGWFNHEGSQPIWGFTFWSTVLPDQDPKRHHCSCSKNTDIFLRRFAPGLSGCVMKFPKFYLDFSHFEDPEFPLTRPCIFFGFLEFQIGVSKKLFREFL